MFRVGANGLSHACWARVQPPGPWRQLIFITIQLTIFRRWLHGAGYVVAYELMVLKKKSHYQCTTPSLAIILLAIATAAHCRHFLVKNCRLNVKNGGDANEKYGCFKPNGILWGAGDNVILNYTACFTTCFMYWTTGLEGGVKESWIL